MVMNHILIQATHLIMTLDNGFLVLKPVTAVRSRKHRTNHSLDKHAHHASDKMIVKNLYYKYFIPFAT